MVETDLLGDRIQRRLGIGYAGRPGMGPEGETCGSCRYARANGHQRKYYKCRHKRALVTASVATDIVLKTPACEFWEIK